MKMLLLAATALALTATAGFAHDEKGDKQVKKIVIMHKDGSEKTIDVDKIHAMADCGGARRFETTQEDAEGDKKQRAKIVICQKGEGDMLAALEKARTRLAGSDDLGTDPRTKALAAIDAEIARLKSAK